MEQEQARGLGEGRLLSATLEREPERARAGAPAPVGGFGAAVAALGPWLLLFPVVGAGLLLTCLGGGSPAPGAAPPAPHEVGLAVAGWSGELATPAGLLSARLSPLHPAPERQAFERRVLARRLDPGPGEPWRLALRFGAAEAQRAGGGAGTRLALAGLGIVGPGGRLAPLAGSAPADGPADPVRVLLAPPTEDLLPGRALHLVLWGPFPGSAPRLEGLVLHGPDGVRALELPLVPVAIAPALAEGFLAREAEPRRGGDARTSRASAPPALEGQREEGPAGGVPAPLPADVEAAGAAEPDAGS